MSIAKLAGPARVDWALGHAAVHRRFGEGDLASILAANLDAAPGPPPLRAGEDRSLTQGTGGWAALGAPTTDPPASPTAATTLTTTPPNPATPRPEDNR